eukprot:jgi/Botrbrau1/22063/Bobra.0024s0072.1
MTPIAGPPQKPWARSKDQELVYRTVLEMREKALGREHPEVAACLNNMVIWIPCIVMVTTLMFVCRPNT